jgi:peptide/nickel transport system permease protein
MTTFIVRRLIQTAVVVLLVSVVAFSLLHLIPGDPVLAILGAEAAPEEVEAMRHELGLDRPVLVQYVHWLANVVRGDFGKSIVYRENVAELLAKRLPVTFYLGFLGLLLSVLVGIPAGVVSAVRRGTFLDSLFTVLATIGITAPVFWLGILGIYLFGLKLGWLPTHGYTSPFEDFGMSLKQAILPVILLALMPMASLARQARSSMLEVIRQDYIRTARAKGLKERAVIMGHALKNAIIPVITLLGLQVRNLVGGSVLVETVFSIPGMGTLMVRSVFDKDYVVVQGCLVVIALVVALANLAVDIAYGYCDPRIRYE